MRVLPPSWHKKGKSEVDKGTYIYALVDAATDVVRYIGKTIYDINARKAAHIATAKRSNDHSYNTHKARWIRRVLDDGCEIAARVLEIVPAGEDWAARERWWVSFTKELGVALTNGTEGGEGTRLFGTHNPFYGRKHTEETIEKLRLAATGKPSGFCGRTHTPEAIEQNRQAHLGIGWTPEMREFFSTIFTGEGNPFYGKRHTDETKAQVSRNRRGKGMGEDNGAVKLTEPQVLEIRKLYASGKWTQTRLAERYSVTQTTVSRIVLRQTWRHV